MGTARIETIMDFARLKVDVAIRCDGCRHKRHMRFEQMEAVFGLGTRIVEAQRRLKCSQCGHKGGMAHAIFRAYLKMYPCTSAGTTATGRSAANSAGGFGSPIIRKLRRFSLPLNAREGIRWGRLFFSPVNAFCSSSPR
jgi:DNA-directed RNA polymerase subunit RPC12/RpoP